MISKYIDNINQRYKLGNATEHTFRGDLQQLIENLVPEIRATNEPKRQKCGAPDYILTKKDIPVGFIEAKDIGDTDLEGLKKTGHKEQFDRYRASLNNLIFTDYLQFNFYRDGQLITKIAIGEITDKGIKPLSDNFAQFENLIKSFCSTIGQTIKSSKKLSEMMAGKARLLSDIIEKSLNSDNTNNEDSTLNDQMNAFKQILIHDITPKSFADVYAQTIAYGMFAARYHDPTLPTFSRQEAYELIPKSNPFLKKLFGYIAGLDVDDRIKWIVDDLVNIFLACDVCELLKDYGKGTKMEDPIIHFYEDFLSEYDPALRKARGVWYTPAPVVNFIVRAVDDILKTEFDLPQGLADTSKTTIKVDMQGKKVEQEVHRVQILDPATGTGTFLAEVVKLIHKKFEGQQGIWSNYVENQLLPRLNGFELLMASYAMAHLKLDLLLTETGYKPGPQFPSTGGVPEGRGGNQRLRVYLTNSLEEHHQDTGTLWANWLSTEANEANRIKRDTPVMCVIGNPPYSVSSTNKGEWIQNLIADYKKNLNERKINLDDDYIKFIRYGQHFIDKNGSGVLAYISNNSFIDGITHRQMRKSLLESFDKIYILDLHGNASKKEVCPDGTPDQNVFDIMVGVSINIFVKTGRKKKNELGKIFHSEIYGKRDIKYENLFDSKIVTIPWVDLEYTQPNLFFVPKDFKEIKEYEKGFKIDELMRINSNGIETQKDELNIFFTKEDSNVYLNMSKSLSLEEMIVKYGMIDGTEWKSKEAVFDLKNNISKQATIQYRPFDYRITNYTGKTNGIMARPRAAVMNNIVYYENYGLCTMRQFANNDFSFCLITKFIIDNRTFYSNRGKVNLFPLYIYSENNTQKTIDKSERIPNLNSGKVKEIAENLCLIFTNEKETTENTFAPIDILDYIYAVLHSPTYREKYKEFLKIDFPRVPYPKDATTFWQLVKLGGEIRQIHLLESPTVEKYITQYPEDGTNMVTKPRFQNSPPVEGCPMGGVVYSSEHILTHINNTPIYRNFIENLPHNPELSQLAKDKRKAGILSEVLFWQQVHQCKFYNIDFDRQRIIGNYIVDFYIKTLGLIVEIDGSSHDSKVEYDAQRQQYLENLGLKVFRISDSDVKKNINAVMQSLENYILQEYGKEPPRLSATLPKEGNWGRVYINDTQYFNNVPEIAWNFYIGGYQPAQKWLKDRKERKLEFDDILHYQKIIVALSETDRLMKEIDGINIE